MKSAIEQLQFLLDHHIRLQFYAETKNGVLLGITGSTLWAMMELSANHSFAGLLGNWMFAISALLLCATIVILVLSFSPIVTPSGEPTASAPEPKRANLVYFGDLSGQRTEDIVSQFQDVQNSERKACEDIASQARTIAQISAQKFNFFKISVGIYLFGLTCSILSIAYEWLPHFTT